METQRILKIMEETEKLQRSLDVPVMISSDEVLKIVVNDLIKKYKSCVERKDTEHIEVFEKVLRYYLSEEEFEEMTK